MSTVLPDLNLKEAAEILTVPVDGDMNDDKLWRTRAVVLPISEGCVEIILTVTDLGDDTKSRTFRATMIEDHLQVTRGEVTT
jgi:hypothetical protein